MEKQQIIQLLSGAAGSVGFGLIFNLRKKYLPLVAAGGFLGWLVYLLCSRYIWEGVFLPTLAASFATAIFAEVLARVCRAPSTLFFLTAVIPLVPGRTLYYCAALWNGDISLRACDCRGHGDCLDTVRLLEKDREGRRNRKLREIGGTGTYR